MYIAIVEGSQESLIHMHSTGDATQNKYATLTDCDLWEVGEEFSRKPYALAVQEGSPLKNDLSSVWVTCTHGWRNVYA